MQKIIGAIAIALLVCACSSIDCPIQNTVYTTYKIYNKVEKVDTLRDTLTVYSKRVEGTDSVFINKDIKVTNFSLPISYMADADTLVFEFKNVKSIILKDTVTVSKTNTPHFESVDCSPSYFHNLTGVKYTKNKIDSIVIKNTTVSYDASKEHFHIYLKSDN